MTTKLLALLSDTHGHLPLSKELEEADIIVHAGDIMPDDRPFEKQADWLGSDFSRWANELGKPIILTWGNHDFAGEKFPDRCRVMMPNNVIVLVNMEVKVGGIRFFGYPYVPRLDRWAFHKTEEGIKQDILKLPSGIDVLITHGPPMGTLDNVYRVGPQGSQGQADAFKQHRLNPDFILPPLHVFGHIHEGRGAYGGKWNVAYLDRNYQPYPRPIPLVEVGVKGGE